MISFGRLRLLCSVLLAAQALGMSRPAGVRTSSFSDDVTGAASEPRGFLEDINFKSFFEDVGLQGSESSPSALIRPESEPSSSDPYTEYETASSNRHFTVVSSDDDFFAQESHPFDDFFDYDNHQDKRSNPFAASQHDREYVSPYSASEHTQRRANFEDYGPPEGFFDDSFTVDFGSEGNSPAGKGEKKKEGGKAQETRHEPKYDQSEPKTEEKEKTKKCEIVHKDGMACEICKDDFGGFSEHCSHNLNSGKDQKYANTKRTSDDEVYNPLKNQKQQQQQQHEPSHEKGSQKAASIGRAYQRDEHQNPQPKESTNPSYKQEQPPTPTQDTPYQTHHEYPSQESSPKTQHSYQPAPQNYFHDYFDSFDPKDFYDTPSFPNESPKDTKHSPALTLTPKSSVPPKNPSQVDPKPTHEVQEVAIFAQKSPVTKQEGYSQTQPKKVYATPKNNHNNHNNNNNNNNNNNKNTKHSPYDPFPDHSIYDPYTFDNIKDIDEIIDIGRGNKRTNPKRHNTQDTHQRHKGHKTDDLPQESQRQRHSSANHYKPLDHIQNFKVLGKMVKQFGKKDRSNCKKRMTKDGMTCYVCPNKHGQVDEECMYENADPKQGVHMMYKEESSY